MKNLIAGTEFERNLRASCARLTDRMYRQLVFDYCQSYQEVYEFSQLENAFAYLALAATDGGSIRSELLATRNEVEEAMDEYFESLNEVAMAIHRLLDDAPFTDNDVLACVAHVWNAHACNEDPAEFRSREDAILCDLLAKSFGER